MKEETRRRRLMIVRTGMGQGGADRVTLTLLQHLDRTLFDIELVVVKMRGVWMSEVPPEIRVHDLRARNLATAWWPLAKMIRSRRPDVVFAMDGGVSIPTAMASYLSRRTARLVFSERNILYIGKRTVKRHVLVFLKRMLYPVADHHAAVSQGVKEDMIRLLKLNPEGITVVYNPIVSDSMLRLAEEQVDDPWFQENIPIILAVGRLVYQKDYITMLRAFAKVRSRLRARLFILGEGPMRQELERLATTLGVQNDVCFAGFDKNPFKYMSRCTVYVLSSRNEGLPGTLIQAMACGAPVISTDCPAGPSEIISQPGKNGFLVPVGDDEAMAQRIEQLLIDPAKRAEMSANGRRTVEKFSHKEGLKAYTDVILGNGCL